MPGTGSASKVQPAEDDDEFEDGSAGACMVPEWTIKQDQLEVLLTQARSCLNQLKRKQTDNLKTFFTTTTAAESEGDSDKVKADLELNFKRLIQ